MWIEWTSTALATFCVMCYITRYSFYHSAESYLAEELMTFNLWVCLSSYLVVCFLMFERLLIRWKYNRWIEFMDNVFEMNEDKNNS